MFCVKCSSQIICLANLDFSDGMQGFQLTIDDLTGFGSIATDTAIRLQEDFPKAKQLAFPMCLMAEPQVGTPIPLLYRRQPHTL